jgi:HlyD family secretion protein
MKKVLIILASVLLLSLGGWYLLRNGSGDATKYRTGKVERGEISETVTATGTINPVTTVQVGSQVSGTIREIRADFNSIVRKGQVIARIDPDRFTASADQARAALESALAGQEKARASLTDADRTLSRSRELFRDGFVARSDVDSAETAQALAAAQLRVAAATVAQGRANLREAETNLGQTTIVSPVDGIVISRNVDVGQTVAASFQTPTLFTIAQDLSNMQIDTSVDEADIARVVPRLPVSFTVDAWPGKTFEGVVEQVRNAPLVAQNVVTYNVVVRVENRGLLLKPGMTANAVIRIRTVADAVKIPNAALRYRPKDLPAGEGKQGKGTKEAKGGKETSPKGAEGAGSAGTVWVPVPGGKPRAVAVRTGINDGSFSEMVSGELPPESEVITGEEGASRKAAANGGSPPGMGMGRLR